jgi:hypothetical protein
MTGDVLLCPGSVWCGSYIGTRRGDVKSRSRAGGALLFLGFSPGVVTVFNAIVRAVVFRPLRHFSVRIRCRLILWRAGVCQEEQSLDLGGRDRYRFVVFVDMANGK